MIIVFSQSSWENSSIPSQNLADSRLDLPPELMYFCCSHIEVHWIWYTSCLIAVQIFHWFIFLGFLLECFPVYYSDSSSCSKLQFLCLPSIRIYGCFIAIDGVIALFYSCLIILYMALSLIFVVLLHHSNDLRHLVFVDRIIFLVRCQPFINGEFYIPALFFIRSYQNCFF